MPIRSRKPVIEFYGVSHVSVSLVYSVRYFIGRKPLKELPVFNYRCQHAESFAWGQGCNRARGLQLAFAILYAYHVKVRGYPDEEDTGAIVVAENYPRFFQTTIQRLPTPGWTLNMQVIERFLTSSSNTSI